MTTTTDSGDPSLQTLGEQLRGAVLQPECDRYRAACSVYNEAVDDEPFGIARCSGVADVMASVQFARDAGLELAIKAGGHHAAGHAICDGLVIDISPMDGVRVDPDNRTVRVQGGATWAALKHELDRFDLEIVGAVNVDDVGVAGYTLGGGMGFSSRRRGLAIDNLRAVDLVTADGRLVSASENENRDLFWALRGGGGNFGVVTSLAFDCHETTRQATVGEFLYPLDQLDDILRFYRRVVADAPDEVTAAAGVTPVDGEAHAFLGINHMGDGDSNGQLFERTSQFGSPIHRRVESVSYNEMGEEPLESGRRNYWTSLFFDNLSDSAIDAFADHVADAPEAMYVAFTSLGGAINRVEPQATAYPHRGATDLLMIPAQWDDPERDDEVISWARSVHDALVPHSTGGEYVNNQTDDGSERARAAYVDNYDRLVELKNAWDPENLFSVNQNIEPAD